MEQRSASARAGARGRVGSLRVARKGDTNLHEIKWGQTPDCQLHASKGVELEIRRLHEKLDSLMMNQWQRLLEIQEIQMDLMEALNQKTHSPRVWSRK